MSSFPSQLLITIVFLFKHISSQSPTSCSNLSPISTVCEDDGYCLINSNSHCTCGQIPWNQDIAFIFDSSMSSTQWTHTTQFAADLLYYGSPSLTTTRTAILQTANPSISSTITLPFGSEPIANTISSTLPNLEQISQSSFYLQLSLQNALNLFNTSSTSNTRKILIIFATKEFSQAPCKINMRANEIYTYTIAIGDFNKYPLTCIGCSENNYSGLISIDNISELSNILTSMEAITCPHKPLIKMTEIQLSGINGQQYIEIYNYGHDIDMSQFQLFDINTPNLPSLQLNQGQFSVIYNTDNQYVTQESIPNCINCQCIESSLTINTNIKWCENTIYIGCCDDNIQNACANNYGFEINLANCKFDNQLSMTAFTIGLIWTNPNTLSQQFIGTLTFDNINLQWPIVATNYALELKNIGYNNQFGSSWTMSCNSNGTPGDNYLLNICPFDCTIDGTNLCNLNGGMNTNQCIGTSCDCLDGFYAYYSTCLPLPLPINCIAIEQGPTASITTYNIAKWDDDTTYLFFHCDISSLGCNSIDQYSETVTSLLTYTVFDQGRDISPTMITLQTIGTNNNIYISQKTICNHITQSPTFNPTLSPTYFIPIVPLCTITLYSDLKRFVLRWNEINFQSIDSPPINTFIGYKYYYNDKFIFIVSCCQITISNTVSFIINSDWVSVSGHWNGITDNEELLSATKCNIITQDPTPLPSKSPTNNPTFKPSINPTNKPTMTPTLGELYVGTCSGTVIRGVSIVNMTWTEANFNINTAPKTDTIYVVEWVYNTRNTPNGYEEISATQNTQKLVTINNYLNVISLQMYCKWSSNTEQGRITICSMFTMLPTISPTIKPSKSPTYPPLNIPSVYPTIYHTFDSTIDPTNDSALISTTDPTLIPTQIPSSVPLSITTINPTNDELNEDIIVRLNISFLIIVHNTTRKEIENITLSLLTKKYGNSSINSYKLVVKADNYTGTLDVSFIESKDTATDIINYINTTFSDDISNELDSPNTVQVIIIYVYISDNQNNEKQSDFSLSMTKIFEYTNIIIGSVFIFIAMIGFIDAKLFRINDVFKITKILQPMIHILDTISDIFLCLEVWYVYQMNDINESDTFFNISVYFLLFCGMSLFILLPIIISIIQLAVISNKYWIHNRGDTAMNMNNEIVRAWLKKYVYILYIASVLFGSSFSAIILFNSNIFCFRIFDMGLSESTLSHFQTHMIYSIVLFENIPQLILQIIYWIFIDSLSIIVIISMIYSMFSIVIRIISTYTQKSIMYMEQAIIIRFDVCGTSVTQNADILRNRLDNIGIQLSALFGVQKTLIEVMRPINIANGLQIIFYVNVTGDINKYLIHFKRFMYEYNRNGSLLCSVKKGWNLSEVNEDKYIIISNINISVKESKQSMDQTVHIQMSNIDNNNNRHKRVNTMSGVYNYNDSNAMSFIPIPMINENNMVTKGQDCKQKTHYLY